MHSCCTGHTDRCNLLCTVTIITLIMALAGRNRLVLAIHQLRAACSVHLTFWGRTCARILTDWHRVATIYSTTVTTRTASLTLNNSTFCPHTVFTCFVWISEQTVIISLYNINWLVCITETECVYCAVRTRCLNVNHLVLVLKGTMDRQMKPPVTAVSFRSVLWGYSGHRRNVCTRSLACKTPRMWTACRTVSVPEHVWLRYKDRGRKTRQGKITRNDGDRQRQHKWYTVYFGERISITFYIEDKHHFVCRG